MIGGLTTKPNSQTQRYKEINLNKDLLNTMTVKQKDKTKVGLKKQREVNKSRKVTNSEIGLGNAAVTP